MTNKDMVFFNAAKEVSKLSDYPRHHIGCVFVLKNRIISSGYNSNKTSPLQRKYNQYRFSVDTPHKLHSETSALIPLLKMKDIDFAHIKVYLYREHANGTLALSKPCESCRKMLIDNGIKHIYYTIEGGYAEEYLVG